jgi:hypothetical protein
MDVSQVALAGVFAAAVDGHHLLISNTGETVRFTLAAGAQVSATPADVTSLLLLQGSCIVQSAARWHHLVCSSLHRCVKTCMRSAPCMRTRLSVHCGQASGGTC